MNYQKSEFKLVKNELELENAIKHLQSKEKDYFYTVFFNLKNKTLGLHKQYSNIFMIMDNRSQMSNFHNSNIEKIKYFMGDCR